MAKSVTGGVDDGDSDGTTPICRCRVLYLGSAVPHITKDGLQGIQEPLRDLYPEQGVFWNADRDHSATGIDSWLSVWSNGILVENVDDKGNTVRRFHPIESLHYCAAVRYVSVPTANGGSTAAVAAAASNDPSQGSSDGKMAKFLPLDSPFSKSALVDASSGGHPPLFACILRRTSGIKVLECHAFICKKEAAANALVRCCFHAYADTMHARQIELESPYEQLDRRRSRSIGSALDSQSLIDEKVNSWQKNSTGGSSSGTADDTTTNGFAADNRSISRQKTRTPSVASLAGPHHAHAHPQHAHHQPPNHSNGILSTPSHMIEPIYYNGVGNGTLRSVRSLMSLATLKSQKKLRPRQIPMPISAPPPPPPVMFATLSKKELKKVLKKESTLKRKHKYKDMPPCHGPFMAAPNGYPLFYGPPPPIPPHGMPIYAPLPPPGPPGAYFTLDSRKGRIPGPHGLPPLPNHMLPPPEPNGHMHMSLPPPQSIEEPIYMPTLSSPNGTLRPITPHHHGEPIYFDGARQANGHPPMQAHMGPPPPPMFIHPQTGNLVPCTLIPTLSRKEMEKQKALMKKAAKKEKKKLKESSGGNKMPIVEPPLMMPEMYQRPSLFPYPNECMPPEHTNDEMMMMMMPAHADDHTHSSYNSASSSGIYKKKGHLNERAFSYSIRQEQRSRSNSLSNLVFDNVPQQPPPPSQPQPVPPPSSSSSAATMNGGERHHRHNGGGVEESASNHASSVSLKSTEKHSYAHGANGGVNSAASAEMYHNRAMTENGKMYLNGNGRMANSNGSLHASHHHHHHHHQQQLQQHQQQCDGIDPNLLASRMSNLKLNGNGHTHPPPPPPPLPPNGYHQQYPQKTATIKRL